MACEISSGFQLACRDNSGGIKNVYILSGSVTAVAEASEGLISGISGSGVFYKFELTKNTGDFTETPTPSLENGTVYYDSTLNISLHKLQSSIRNQVRTLAQNPDLKIIIETNNGAESPFTGRFFYMGRDRGATLSGGSGATGTAFGDMNGYSLTFQGLEPNPADEISTATGLLTGSLGPGLSVGS
tara:strand:- start:1718 stop:2275 length:558 start_codon:yes stop_codon:yes gene_type:complete